MNGDKNTLIVASTGADPQSGPLKDANSSDASAPADIALNLIFEAGNTVRSQEERIAHAVSELRRVVQFHQGNLEQAEARANTAESELLGAKIEMKALFEKLCDARDSLAALKEIVVARERDLAAMNERAEAAKRQALDMSAVLSMLIEEIRSKLPTGFGGGE